jgi:uncharacterized membrane protein (DUF373 family)
MDREPVLGGKTRTWIARAFTIVEDVVYVGLGLLLAGSAIALLVGGATDLVQHLASGPFSASVVGQLDQILLILLVVELLYTVQVSFREHTVVPEPFLLVGLIAVIRRVLVLTAQFGEVKERPEEVYRHFFIELSVLTFLVVALAASIVLLRKSGRVAAHRA